MTFTKTGIEGAQARNLIRTMFEMARERAPSIVFVDEADGFYETDVENTIGNEAKRAALDELIAQMNGVSLCRCVWAWASVVHYVDDV